MSSKFFKLETLLVFILVGTVIAYPDDYDKEQFKKLLFKDTLASIIKNPLKNETYQMAELVNAKDQLKNGNKIWELSVVITNYENDQELQSNQKRCDHIYVTQNEMNILSATDESAQCRYINDDENSDQKQKISNVEFLMFESVLLEGPLTSLLQNPLKNEAYKTAQLLRAAMIAPKNGFNWELSVVVTDNNIQQCRQKRCDIYVKQDESDKLSANDKPEQCRCMVYSRNENQITEPVKPFFGDRIVEEFIERSSGKYLMEYNNNEVLSTALVNATEQESNGITLYKINYHLVEAICEDAGAYRDCTGGNNRVRLCTIKVSKPHRTSVEDATMTDTCEKKITSSQLR